MLQGKALDLTRLLPLWHSQPVQSLGGALVDVLTGLWSPFQSARSGPSERLPECRRNQR